MSPDAPAARLLEVDRLVVSYGPVIALRDVSLFVEKGEIVAVLGPNGAGKTTLLRAVAGAVRPLHGTITYGEGRIDGLASEEIVRLGVAMVPEGRHIFPRLTVAENVAIGAIARVDRDEIRADLESTLEMFPILRERASQWGGTLSGGEQQQLAIARGLMSRPTLMLLDEPSLGLAPIVLDRTMDLIAGLRDRGVTILLVEQNVHRALEIADRAYVLAVGKMVLSGAAKELRETGSLERAYLGLAGAK